MRGADFRHHIQVGSSGSCSRWSRTGDTEPTSVADKGRVTRIVQWLQGALPVGICNDYLSLHHSVQSIDIYVGALGVEEQSAERLEAGSSLWGAKGSQFKGCISSYQGIMSSRRERVIGWAISSPVKHSVFPIPPTGLIDRTPMRMSGCY